MKGRRGDRWLAWLFALNGGHVLCCLLTWTHSSVPSQTYKMGTVTLSFHGGGNWGAELWSVE